MAEPIVVVESFRIRPGKADEFLQAATKVCESIDAQEPQLIAYKFYLNNNGSEGTTLHIHPDSASLAHHQSVIGPA